MYVSSLTACFTFRDALSPPRAGEQRPEGMRNLQKLVDSRDVGLAAILGLIHAHKQADVVDKDAIKELEVRCSCCFCFGAWAWCA